MFGANVLQPRLFLGLRTDIESNVQYVTDDDIIYPVGGVLALHNFNQKRQKFIRLAEKGKNVTAILVSPNKKVIAVAESGEKPVITLYCPTTFKKKKVLNLPSERETQATKYVVIAFTFDSKKLICIAGEPDWMLYCFRLDKGKVESLTRANNINNTGIVKQLACNPNDINVVCLVGENLVRILACAEYSWKQYGFSKADQWNFTSCAWLSQEKLMLGSDDGRLLIIESGELRAIFHASDLLILNLKFEDDLQQPSQTSLPTEALSDTQDLSIRNLIMFSRGFAFSYLNGTVHLFEMETPHKYTKRSVFKVPEKRVVTDNDTGEEECLTVVNSIAINPSQDALIVTTKLIQIFSVTLWLTDLNSHPEVILSDYGHSLHNGPIGCMAVCSWKPLLMTSGKVDRMLKMWNYETEELELQQKFQDDLFGTSLHPTGLFAIVGFTDKLRFLSVMTHEFVTKREFAVRTCTQVCFSKLGHLFAAANGITIQVYSSISFELLYVLKGHNDKISQMSWSKDDRKMSTCGHDGAVYEWIVTEKKRVSETIIKQCIFTGVALSSDSKVTFVTSNDGHVRELHGSSVYRDVDIITDGGLDTICLSQMDQILFVSGSHGSVYHINLPLMEKAECVEYIMHSSVVTQIRISFDDRFIFTGSTDGSICIWKVINAEGKAIKMDKDFAVSTDILCARAMLDEKNGQIRDLQLRINEMETEAAYQLKQNDAIHSLMMKDIHSGYCQAIEELKEKNEQLELDHMQEIENINADIAKMKQDHERFIEELEACYNQKLIFEYEKFLRLEEKLERMRRGYEKELEELRAAKKESETKLTDDFLEKLHEKQLDYEDLVEKMRQKDREHESIKQQIEEDADREIYELKTQQAKKLKEEMDLNVKIKGETAIAKKKMLAALKEVDDLKHHVYLMEDEHEKFKRTIIDLEKDISDLKKEIAERDSTIQDKEKRIFELKNKNQELEKFKFILEFKITELKTQIEPREKRIEEQALQINEMVKELENLQKVIINMDVQFKSLKEKLTAAAEEIRTEIARNVTMQRAMKKIKIEIYQASRCIQNTPMLVKAVKNMYQKFETDKDFEVMQAEDSEAKSEFLRQRDFLERTVAQLQQMVHKSLVTGVERVRLVEENAKILEETNHLRRQLREEIKHNKKLHNFIGPTRNVAQRIINEKIKFATTSREEIHEKYKKQIEENDKIIEALREENNRLIAENLDTNLSEEQCTGNIEPMTASRLSTV